LSGVEREGETPSSTQNHHLNSQITPFDLGKARNLSIHPSISEIGTPGDWRGWKEAEEGR